jgi:hypothetical protein
MKKSKQARHPKRQARPEATAPPDVVSLPSRRALEELDLPPDVVDPPPLQVLQRLVELKKQGFLEPEFLEQLAEEARKHGLRFGPQE